MQILIDTNVLLYAVKNKLDLKEAIHDKFGLAEIFVPSPVMEELKKLKRSAVKKSLRENADLACEIIRHSKFQELKLPGQADQVILNYACRTKASVLTNDLELRYRLKEYSVPVFCIRQGKYIVEW